MDEWAKRSSSSFFHSSFSVFPLLRYPSFFLSILLFNIISFPFTVFHIFFNFNCTCFLSDLSLVYCFCSARLSRLFHPAKCSSTRYRLKTSPVIMIKFHVTKGQDGAEKITQASLLPVPIQIWEPSASSECRLSASVQGGEQRIFTRKLPCSPWFQEHKSYRKCSSLTLCGEFPKNETSRRNLSSECCYTASVIQQKPRAHWKPYITLPPRGRPSRLSL